MYPSPHIIWVIKRMRWAGYVARTRGRDEVYTEFWLRNLKEKPFGRPRSRGENRIEIDIKGAGWDCVSWINLFQDTLSWQTFIGMVMNLRAP